MSTENLTVPPDELATRYANWLEQNRQSAAKQFRRRLATSREDAVVEAVTWWVLAGWYRYDVTVGEQYSGGPDFDCRNERSQTLLTVEATTLRSEALSRITTVPPEPGDFAGSIGNISEALYERVARKLPQSRTREHPVAVVVGTTHWFHDVALDRWAAEELISGRRSISFAVGQEAQRSSLVTDLQGSVFIRLQEGYGVEAANAAIAAVLLLGVAANEVRLIGVLNPWAKHPLDPDLLAGIPFCKGTLQEDRGGIALEWVIGSPDPAVIGLVRVPLPGDNKGGERSET